VSLRPTNCMFASGATVLLEEISEGPTNLGIIWGKLTLPVVHRAAGRRE